MSKVCPKCKTENPKVASFCRHCRYEFPEATKNGTSISPQILFFKVLETVYTIGSVVHLDWAIENATIIKLNEYDVTNNCTAELVVEKAETIRLTAENDYDKVERSVRISPRPLPSIKSFSTSHSSIRSGQEVKLKWDFRNAVKAKLVSSEGEIDVTYKTFIKVLPKHSETYQLICYSCDERIFEEKSIQVSVIAPVVIRGFFADKDVVAESDKVVLTWDVDNATTIMLHPMMKDVTKLKKMEVNPSRTTEYRLVATNNISQQEQSVSVGVRQLPKMDIKFADSLSTLKMPSCNIDLSFIFESAEKAKIDEWMAMKPIEEIKFTTRLNSWIVFMKNMIVRIREII